MSIVVCPDCRNRLVNPAPTYGAWKKCIHCHRKRALSIHQMSYGYNKNGDVCDFVPVATLYLLHCIANCEKYSWAVSSSVGDRHFKHVEEARRAVRKLIAEKIPPDNPGYPYYWAKEEQHY